MFYLLKTLLIMLITFLHKNSLVYIIFLKFLYQMPENVHIFLQNILNFPLLWCIIRVALQDMMEATLNIRLPFTKEIIKQLKAGDTISVSGVMYTARDAAHKRMMQALSSGEPLPFDVEGQTIYYAGPCPAKPGAVIGSCGPTTSGRMDSYTPTLLDLGLIAMIGKGERSSEVLASMKKNGAIYLGAIGGAGALYADSIKKVEVIAYEDLGPESVKRLEVENMPLTVICDIHGNNLYDLAKQ